MCKRYKTAYKGAGHLPCPFDEYQNGTITFMKSQWLQMNYYICMWQKCGDMGINGFTFKKLNSNINERKNSWLFRIFLQNSTVNLHLDWAELAVLFSRQILNGPQDLFLSFIFILIFDFNFQNMKPLRPLPPNFCHILIYL